MTSIKDLKVCIMLVTVRTTVFIMVCIYVRAPASALALSATVPPRSPSSGARSAATRVATLIAARRRGCVHTTCERLPCAETELRLRRYTCGILVTFLGCRSFTTQAQNPV